MSAAASCVLVDAEVLAKLVAEPREWSQLTRGAKTITYGWSGFVLATLLPYLGQHGIELMDSAYSDALTNMLGATCFVLEPKHRAALDALDPAKHDAATLRAFYESFTESPGDGVETPMLDGVRFLYDALAAVSGNVVGVVVIG